MTGESDRDGSARMAEVTVQFLHRHLITVMRAQVIPRGGVAAWQAKGGLCGQVCNVPAALSPPTPPAPDREGGLEAQSSQHVAGDLLCWGCFHTSIRGGRSGARVDVLVRGHCDSTGDKGQDTTSLAN